MGGPRLLIEELVARRAQRTVHHEVGVAANRRREVGIARRREAEVAEILGGNEAAARRAAADGIAKLRTMEGLIP